MLLSGKSNHLLHFRALVSLFFKKAWPLLRGVGRSRPPGRKGIELRPKKTRQEIPPLFSASVSELVVASAMGVGTPQQDSPRKRGG